MNTDPLDPIVTRLAKAPSAVAWWSIVDAAGYHDQAVRFLDARREQIERMTDRLEARRA